MTRTRWSAALCIVTLLGLAIRIAMMKQGLFGDELFTFEIATHSSLGDVISGVRSDLEVSPPLYNILAWGTHWLADPTVSIRFPSLVAGTALIPVVYALGVAARNRYAGLLAAVLFSLSPFATFYAVEARPYSLMMLLLALSTLVLLKATEEEGQTGWWAAFTLLTTLAMYTHYTASFVIVGQGLWLLAFRRRFIGSLLLAWVVSALLFVPWLPELVNDRRAPGSSIISWFSPFTVSAVWGGFVRLLLGAPFSLPVKVPGRFALALDALALMLALVGAGLAAFRGQRLRVSESFALVTFTAFATPLGLLLYGVLLPSIYSQRNLAASLPALLALAAAGICALPKRFAVASASLLVVGFVAGAVASLAPANARPNFRAVAALVDRRSPNDVLLDYSGFGDSGPPERQLQVALKKPRVSVFVQLSASGANYDLKAAAMAHARSGHIILVMPAMSRIEKPRIIPGFHLVYQRSFDGLVLLVVFIYAEDAPLSG